MKNAMRFIFLSALSLPALAADITDGIDFTGVAADLITVGAAIIGLIVGIKGITYVIGMLRKA